MTASPRICIVGAGLMGRWHAHELRRLGLTVHAVADPGPAGDTLTRRHPGARRYRTLAEAIRDADPDVVHVCTPRDTHTPLVTEALTAGCHVIVEKPVASTLEDTEGLVALARRRRRTLCPVHQYPFQDGVLAALAKRDRIGAIRHLDAVACSAGADGAPDAERHQVALEILPHPLSLVDAVFPGRLGAVRWEGVATGPGELRVVGSLDAVSVGMLISMAGRPTRNTLRVVGERGTCHVDLFHGFSTIETGEVSQRSKILRPFALASATLTAASANLARRALRRAPAYPGLRELLRRCYRAIADGSDPPISLQSTLDVAAALAAIADALPARHVAHSVEVAE